jgi:anti-sigma factor RsiW
MTCDAFRDRLDGYIAGRLPADQMEAMARHASACDGCRDDLDAAVALAGPLATLSREITPEADLWPGVARRITPVPWRRRMLAAAAVLLLMAGSSVTTAVLVRRPPSAVPSVAGAEVARAIEARYGARTAELAAVLDRERKDLAPATVAAIERNLAVIDRAIAESRAALDKDPSDPDLRTLFRTSQAQRVALLEQATRIAREL